MNPGLARELDALQERLREIEAQEASPKGKAVGVFISYCHADGDFVDELTRRFASDNIDYWRDEKDLLVGQVIDVAVCEGIQENALLLIVLCSASINSSWVSRELDEAAHEASEGRKVLLPVLAEGLSLDGLPPRIRRFKRADFNRDFDIAYLLLLKSIRGHLRRAHEGLA